MAKNVKKREIQLSDFQLKYEKILQIAALVLAIIHMTMVPFRYVVSYLDFKAYELWYGLVLVIGIVVYLILTKVHFPNTWFRIKALFSRLSSYEQLYGIGLFAWAIISCWYYQSRTGQAFFHVQDWFLFDMAINMMILLPMAKFLGKDKAKKIIELMLHVVVWAYTFFTFWCLWNVFHLNIVTLPAGGQVGMDSNSRLYLGCHYNITGAIALTMLALCLYMIFQKRKFVRILYIFAGLAHLLVAMLSNSRTVFVAGLVMVAVAGFMACWTCLIDKTFWTRIGISATGAVISVAVYWAVRPLAFLLFEQITHFKELLGSSSSISDDVRELTSLSGRRRIWLASLKVMFSSSRAFFFGVTWAATTQALMQIGGLTFECAHAHNAILQVGVAYGVPAMIGFIIFLAFIFLRSIQILFGKKEQSFHCAYMVPVVVLCLVVMNLAEAYLVGYYAIMSSVFFLFCGWIMEMEEGSLKELLKPFTR